MNKHSILPFTYAAVQTIGDQFTYVNVEFNNCFGRILAGKYKQVFLELELGLLYVIMDNDDKITQKFGLIPTK